MRMLTTRELGRILPSWGDSLIEIYGFSAHRGVVILWDETFDPGVKYAIDIVRAWGYLDRLVAAYKHKGPLILMWANEIPTGVPDSLIFPDLTRWRIQHSEVKSHE